MDLNQIFDTLKDGSTAYEQLSKSTHDFENQESWLIALREQTDKGLEIYDKCKAAVAELNTVLTGDLTAEQADIIFGYAYEIYLDNWADTFILRICAEKLLDYYKSVDNVGRIITLEMILGFSYVDLARIDRSRYLNNGIENYIAVIEYRMHPILLTNADLAKRVITAFYNVCVVASTILADYVPLAWKYYDLLEKWEETDYFRELHAKYDFFDEEIGDIKTFFYGSMFDIDPSYNSEFLENYFEKKWQNLNIPVTDLTADDCDDYVSHLKLAFRKAPENARALYHELKTYYENGKNSIRGDEYITGFYTACLDHLRVLFTACNFSEAERVAEQTYLKGQMLLYISKEQASPISNALLTECIPDLLFKYHFLDLYDTADEKVDLLFAMFIKCHISTYLHSNMVAQFSCAIAKAVIEQRPDLLIGLSGLTSANEVAANSDLILQMITRHALLHDIGKIGIQEIVSRQYRPLNDEEFSIIKSHPVIGYNYLSSVAGLEQYANTALFHHRFYNGQGGYPPGDYPESELKIISDLITLADCLDAATDYLGRNYRRAKTVDTVIEEFVSGAGVRYNPDLVELLKNDSSLRKQLSQIAAENREDLFRSFYKESQTSM